MTVAGHQDALEALVRLLEQDGAQQFDPRDLTPIFGSGARVPTISECLRSLGAVRFSVAPTVARADIEAVIADWRTRQASRP